jgi:hypothetical protein
VLLTFAAIGIAAAAWPRDGCRANKVELGLAPIGSIGMGVFAILLSQSDTRSRWRRSTWRWSASSAGCSPCR